MYFMIASIVGTKKYVSSYCIQKIKIDGDKGGNNEMYPDLNLMEKWVM